jgi:hypothetical protein
MMTNTLQLHNQNQNKMKITNSTLMLTVENNIEVGPLSLKTDHMLNVYRDKTGELSYDLDFMGRNNVVFAGVKLEDSYKAWQKFVNFHKEMGIDFDKQIRDEADKIMTDDNIMELINSLDDALKQLI